MPYGHGPLWARLRLLGFELSIALIIFSQGVVGLVGGGIIDPIGAFLPTWGAYAFYGLYVLSGTLIVLGLAAHRGDLEASGLVLLISLLLVRGFLTGELLGWDIRSWTSLTFSLFLIGACVGRMSLILWTSSHHDPEHSEVVGVEVEVEEEEA